MGMSKPSRYKGLRPNPEKLGVTPLAAGEGTRTYRVRASEDVLTWFGTMSAEERGRFIERAHALASSPQATDWKAALAHLAPQDKPAFDPNELKTFRFSGRPLGVSGGPSAEQIISEGRGEK